MAVGGSPAHRRAACPGRRSRVVHPTRLHRASTRGRSEVKTASVPSSDSGAAAVEARDPRLALSIRGLSKTFGNTRALSGVDLDLRAGEVHALVGQNGSGKSTLIKILSGYHAPDGGTVSIDGVALSMPMTHSEVEGAGLRFVHQNPGLCPLFTVVETVRLRSWDLTWYGRIQWQRERTRVRALLEDPRSDPVAACRRRRTPSCAGHRRSPGDPHSR
ncbi:MAG: ATP-binding cassette domain-containing protein [Acidimicrobiales bacterium]